MFGKKKKQELQTGPTGTVSGEKKPGSKKRKIVILAIIGTVAVAVIIGGLVFYTNMKKKLGNLSGMLNGSGATSVDLGDAVTAYGVINVGTVDETLSISNMTTNLVIDQILFSSGDSVQEGDGLVRFTEESVTAALEELSKNLREADLAYRAGAISYEESLITAKYTYDSTILKGEQADAVYNESAASLKSSLESSKKSYNESVQQLAEYKDAEANNTYYTDYQVEYYKSVYDENLAVLTAKIAEWGLSWNDVTRGGGRLGADLQSQQLYVCQQLYSVLETNLRNYENALEKYENAMADLTYNRQTLELNMSSLEESYLNAQKSYETGLLNAEQTRQTAKTNAELAESEYEANVEKAKTDYDSLKSKYEDALEDYETFTTRIVDNVYLASETATVTRSNVRANGRVSAGSRILSYSDPDDVTVSVSVDQKDIAKLAVGDTAICYSSDSGMLGGTIVSISPVTQSESISSATYSVTVKISGSGAALSSNTSVTVLFGMDMSTASGMDLSGLSSGESDGSGFDFMNGGSFNFDMSNLPDMSNMPNMGSRP